MSNMIKSLALQAIGPKNAGRVDYLLNRKSKDAWGPLNGQRFRQQVYLEIMSRIAFNAIVETGTFRGTSTEFFAKSGLPVYTVEIDPRAYGYSCLRFRTRKDQIHVCEGNSPDFLRHLSDLPGFPKSRVFFYLDAHVQDSSRYHKPPLIEELTIIYTRWTEAVTMIDDFQVPETDYGFIDGGPDRSLNLHHLRSLRTLRLSAFFPTAVPNQETGAKRGWVVLCQDDNTQKVLTSVRGLMLSQERS
jgi:hypothetical protein